MKMRTPRKKYLGKNQWMPHLCEDYPSENENICMVLKTADKPQGEKMELYCQETGHHLG